MFDKLESIKDRYDELTNKIADPEVISDSDLWQKLVKEHASIEEVVLKYEEYKKTLDVIDEDKSMLNEKLDSDFKEMVESEINELEGKKTKLEEDIKVLLIPKDPNDEKNVIVEIRGGAGGEEAALFAADLYRMYSMYAEAKRWKVEVMNSNQTDLGGFKEIVFSVEGKGAYSRLKYESGVHRVQRVPETEAGGRIHTSTATVAVLPEAKAVDIEIKPDDIKVDVFRSSGHGGQSVNTTDSAVRITHLPTGIVITCQDERSQLKNKDRAMKYLRAKLYDIAREEQTESRAENRKLQVGTGDRSERIRTYNYPQGRVSDHRINLTLYKLNAILDGDLDELIDALTIADQTEKLEEEVS